jgi:glycosyltransferase involved in cell wall biosynthesis
MKKRISLLLPTRGRPKLVERFFASLIAQSACRELIEVIVCVDDDDLGSHAITSDELDLKLIKVPRQGMGAYNTMCARRASGDILIAVNDDIIIRTKDWDEKVRALDARYPDGIYLGYGNDLIKRARFSTFPILPRETYELLADPYPIVYKGSFIDAHLMDIFWRLKKRGYDRIAYAEDIVFEHLHYRVNPDALDATYTDRLRFGDDPTFIALVESRRREADRLVVRISDKSLDVVPYTPRIVVERTSHFRIIPLCARKFLFDFDLPLDWRTYLFVWMLARYYYSRLFRVS